MYRLLSAGLLPALCLVSGAARAAPIVTETELLAALDASHPAVTERSQEVAAAQARADAAAALNNPVLGAAREDLGGAVEETEWALSWQLPDAARRPEIEARQAAVSAAEARLAHDLLSLRLSVREAYAEWAAAEVRRERLAARSARLEGLAEREAARAERGEASGLEGRRLALAAAGLRSRLALADADLERARAGVASWLALPRAEVRPVLPELPPAPELGADHPRLRTARAELHAATLERRAAGRFVRSPELTLGWKREEGGPRSLDGPTVGLAWSLPLFARRRPERDLAEARITAARARLALVERELAATRAAAMASYARLAAAAAEAEVAVADNERMLRGAEAAFRHGETSLTDLLDTLRSAAEAEETALELRLSALAAHRELERLADPHTTADPSSRPTPEEPTR